MRCRYKDFEFVSRHLIQENLGNEVIYQIYLATLDQYYIQNSRLCLRALIQVDPPDNYAAFLLVHF